MAELQFKPLVALVLGIAAVGILIFAFTFLGERAEQGGQRLECQTSVHTNSGLNQDILTFSTEIECPTRKVVISEKIQGNEVLIRDKIAKEMIQCFEDFGKGDKQLFHDTGQQTFCSFCALIRFEDKDQELDGMLAHLWSYPVGAGKQKYWDILYPSFTIEDVTTDVERFLSGVLEEVDISTIAGSTDRFNAFKNHLITRDPGISTNDDLAIMYIHGQYTGPSLQRWARTAVGMEGIIANSAVTYMPFTADYVTSLQCTSFPLVQLKDIDFLDDEEEESGGGSSEPTIGNLI